MVENAIFTLKTQIMATLTLVIVPAKKLSDGTHKIRIRVAHNSETRFITTDIVVRENEFKNGKKVFTLTREDKMSQCKLDQYEQLLSLCEKEYSCCNFVLRNSLSGLPRFTHVHAISQNDN